MEPCILLPNSLTGRTQILKGIERMLRTAAEGRVDPQVVSGIRQMAFVLEQTPADLAIVVLPNDLNQLFARVAEGFKHSTTDRPQPRLIVISDQAGARRATPKSVTLLPRSATDAEIIAAMREAIAATREAAPAQPK